MTTTMHTAPAGAAGGSSGNDVWAQLAAPLPQGVISWRQDGRPVARDGRFFARHVAYIEANTVRERLDGVVPGEWSLAIELLPALATDAGSPSESFSTDGAVAFKARLQILGVVREDVGVGKDYKQASTDAFKRVAVRFGIGHELYAYEQNWVRVDSDSKYAKPVEDPQTVYTRRYGTAPTPKQERQERAAAAKAEAKAERNGKAAKSAAGTERLADVAVANAAPEVSASGVPVALEPEVAPSCPKCGGKVWDNRATKRNPKAPDFKCRDRTCDGVIWPPKPVANERTPAPAVAEGPADQREVTFDSAPLGDADEIPF
jgi:hypothetical protein